MPYFSRAALGIRPRVSWGVGYIEFSEVVPFLGGHGVGLGMVPPRSGGGGWGGGGYIEFQAAIEPIVDVQDAPGGLQL